MALHSETANCIIATRISSQLAMRERFRRTDEGEETPPATPSLQCHVPRKVLADLRRFAREWIKQRSVMSRILVFSPCLLKRSAADRSCDTPASKVTGSSSSEI